MRSTPAIELGRHKARVFASALGITAADWRYLDDAILVALPEATVRSTRITPFGVTYEVVESHHHAAFVVAEAVRCRPSAGTRA